KFNQNFLRVSFFTSLQTISSIIGVQSFGLKLRIKNHGLRKSGKMELIEMNDEKIRNGTVEAFSFRKSVVKIDGHWFNFGREVEGTLRELKTGETVNYTVENRNLQWIQKTSFSSSPTAEQLKIEKTNAKPVQQPNGPATVRTVQSVQTATAGDSRNRSIERQVALKAAVELAELYGYKSINECLDVAASFAAWIDSTGSVQLPERF
ncbi:MAG: hypothetical protein KKG10_07235, partial [Proteobacteria bacterium]|nr:hypothetical protein [Pseudomonadota bacterium]